MPSPAVLMQGVVSRNKPQPFPDGVRDGAPERAGRYGEPFSLNLIQKAHGLADEGSYFVTSNPTPGTGIANQAAPTGAPGPAGGNTDTKPICVIQNLASPSDGTRMYLDYLRLRCTAPGTNGTAINFTAQIDYSANRIPAATTLGGSALVPVNCNMDSGLKSSALVTFGNNVVTASGNSARVR